MQGDDVRLRSGVSQNDSTDDLDHLGSGEHAKFISLHIFCIMDRKTSLSGFAEKQVLIAKRN